MTAYVVRIVPDEKDEMKMFSEDAIGRLKESVDRDPGVALYEYTMRYPVFVVAPIEVERPPYLVVKQMVKDMGGRL